MLHKHAFGFTTLYTKNIATDIATDIIDTSKKYGYTISINSVAVYKDNDILTLEYNGTISDKLYHLNLYEVNEDLFLLYHDMYIQGFSGEYKWLHVTDAVSIDGNKISWKIKLRKLNDNYITYFDFLNVDVLMKIGDVIWKNLDSAVYNNVYEQRDIIGKAMGNYLRGIDGYSKGLDMDSDTKKIIKKLR